MMPIPVGDQLELFSPGAYEILRIPWGGLSPRALTRGSKVVILKAQAGRSVSAAVLLDLFETDKIRKGARVYSGAPLLFPLLRRNDHGTRQK